ncbi:MAG TPA: serine hydrolase domain-containing protein [Geobacteraceae bacterium]
MGVSRRIGCGLAVVMLLLAGCATTMPKKPAEMARGDYGYTKEYVSWLIREEMDRHKVTGLSVALVDDQKVVWAQGFGYADKERGIAATPETVYRAGSISKLFTATAAMQLAEDGLFDIDQPLRTYLPEFSVKNRFPYASPITPRTLMTHHSGLPSDLVKGMWSTAPEPFEEDVKLLRDEYAAYPPDYVFSYSNVGMTLLGHALEKVAGRDFAPHMSLALFLPLKMESSSFSAEPDRTSLAAKAYRDGEEEKESPLRDVPAGGLNTSVLDLSRFMAMVFANGWAGEKQILKSQTLAEMLRPQNSRVHLDLSFRVGLGWMLGGVGDMDIRNAGPVAHHSGATLYHRSQLIILPDQKLGVAVLANSASAGGVVSRVATETLKLALEAKAGITQPKREEQAEGKVEPQSEVKDEPAPGRGEPLGKGAPREAQRKGPLTPEELKAFEGRYATIAGVVSVVAGTDYLDAEVLGRSIRLVSRPDGLLAMRYKVLGFFPVGLGELEHVGIGRASVDGRDILKAVADGKEILVGERLKPVPIPEKWLARVGGYEIANPGDDVVLVENIRLRNDKGLLTVEYAMPLFLREPVSLALSPLSDSEAVIEGLGRGKGETIRVVAAEGKEYLAYGGYLLRKRQE